MGEREGFVGPGLSTSRFQGPLLGSSSSDEHGLYGATFMNIQQRDETSSSLFAFLAFY